jgi:calcineurin-like phosphoesterase family protein
MTKFIALGATAIAVLAIAAATSSAGNPNTLTLAVYGDSPYWDTTKLALPKKAEFDATPAFIQTINADPSIQEVVHVGDIHSGSEACTVPFDEAVFDFWKAFVQPLIYTPGDNEWSDCSKAKELAGTDVFGNPPDRAGNPAAPVANPLANLSLVRSIFFADPGWTLGQHPMQVISQATAFDPAHPEDAAYVENVMWEQSKTLFVTLNLPGGSNNDSDAWNNKAGATPPLNNNDQSERSARTAADVRWLNQALATAEADNAHSVVIVGQADMWDTADSPSHQNLYEPIVEAMADDTTTFGKPVLYLNGDSHVYRSDNPLQKNSTCYIESGSCGAQTVPCAATTPTNTDAWCQHPYYDVPNFHRIVVHGSTFPMEWLKLSIDPRAAWENRSTATSWGPFSWQREIQDQLTPPTP